MIQATTYECELHISSFCTTCRKKWKQIAIVQFVHNVVHNVVSIVRYISFAGAIYNRQLIHLAHRNLGGFHDE